MSSTIGQRPFAAGPDDPTARLAAVVPRPTPVLPPYAAFHHGPVPPPAGYPVAQPWQAGGRPARPGRPSAGWIAMAACGAVLLVALLAAAVSANSSMTVSGTLTLHMGNYLPAGSSCEGANFASWLHDGTVVTIYDASGDVVGTTTLRSGTATASGSEWSSSYADTCVFPFTLSDVPSGDDFYRVAAGSSSGGVTFTADELREDGANLTIGD